MWNIFIKFLPIFFLGSKIETPPKNNIKGAIFDLDGTLLDTEIIYAKIDQELIIKYGNGKKYVENVRKKIMGVPRVESCKILAENYDIKIEAEELANIRDEMLETAFLNCNFLPGAREITHKLKYEFNLKNALATSSPKLLFDSKTNHIKDWLKNDIDKVVLGDDKRLKKGKPDPQIFLLAINDLGLNVKECIIFEDAISGINAAINAGVPIVVGIPDPLIKEEVKEIKYDKSKTKLIILDSLKDFDFSLIK